jgi:hypothetical protein
MFLCFGLPRGHQLIAFLLFAIRNDLILCIHARSTFVLMLKLEWYALRVALALTRAPARGVRCFDVVSMEMLPRSGRIPIFIANHLGGIVLAGARCRCGSVRATLLRRLARGAVQGWLAAHASETF